jgi:hypothetical protein
MRPTLLYQKKGARKAKAKRSPKYRTEAKAAFKAAYEDLFGSQGAASPVRKIDPVTGEVIAIIKPR